MEQQAGNPELTSAEAPPSPRLPLLAFASLGIVFGDVWTRPLYTFKAIFSDTVIGVQATEAAVKAAEPVAAASTSCS